MDAAALPVRVLIVDDDEQARAAMGSLLATRRYETVCVADAPAARDQVATGQFQVVLCDVRLPGESGMQLAQELAQASPHLAVIMVSGVNDLCIAETALEIGAYDYLVKPFSANDVLIAVANAVRRRAALLEDEAARRQLTAVLEEHREALVDATAALADVRASLNHSRHATLYKLARVAEIRNEDMGDHMERVGLYAELIATGMGLEETRCSALRMASPLHDVGKIGLPDQILLKPGPLDDDERLMMQGHTEVGYALLMDREDALLDLAARIALTHHERVDGTGYPNGLAGEEIPLESRIVAVADAFDAMTSNRPYRAAMTARTAFDRVREGAGSQFDPTVVQAALEICDGGLNAIAGHAFTDFRPAAEGKAA
jgi:putative two-component system response regulator